MAKCYYYHHHYHYHYYYHSRLNQKSLFKEKVHAILLKIFEAQDSYADLNTIISDFYSFQLL